MRLFIAAQIPQGIRDGLAALMTGLKKEIPGLRWVRPEGMHLTLRFLGDVAESDLARLGGEVRRNLAGSAGPFDVRVEGLGLFPEKGRARVLWVDLVEPTGALVVLHSMVERAVVGAALPGVKKEDRPFRPHLTLARFGDGRPPSGIASAVAARQQRGWGQFTVSSVCVFQSLLKPGGAEYRRLEEYRL